MELKPLFSSSYDWVFATSLVLLDLRKLKAVPRSLKMIQFQRRQAPSEPRLFQGILRLQNLKKTISLDLKECQFINREGKKEDTKFEK